LIVLGATSSLVASVLVLAGVVSSRSSRALVRPTTLANGSPTGGGTSPTASPSREPDTPMRAATAAHHQPEVWGEHARTSCSPRSSSSRRPLWTNGTRIRGPSTTTPGGCAQTPRPAHRRGIALCGSRCPRSRTSRSRGQDRLDQRGPALTHLVGEQITGPGRIGEQLRRHVAAGEGHLQLQPDLLGRGLK